MIFGDLTKKAERLSRELGPAGTERKLKLIRELSALADEDPKALVAAVPRIVEALGDQSGEVRVASLNLLNSLAKSRSNLRREIVAAVLDGLARFRENPAEALTLLRKHASSASEVVEERMPELVGLLESEKSDTREAAAMVLEELGVPARRYAAGIAETKLIIEEAARCGARVDKAEYLVRAARTSMERGFYDEVDKNLELAREFANTGRKMVRLWRVPLPEVRAVAIAPDGGFACAAAGDGRLHAFERTGKPLWSQPLPERGVALKVSHDGKTVVAGCGDGSLVCFDAVGRRLWAFRMGGAAVSLDVTEDGTVLCSASDNNIYVVSREGNLTGKHWTERPGWRLAVSGDGDLLLVTFKDHNVYCYDRNVFLRWKHMGGIWSAVAISRDGETLAAGSQGNDLVVFSKIGAVSWKSRTEDSITHLAISADGSAVYAADGRHLYSYDRAGRLLFRYSGRDPMLSMASSATGELLAVGLRDKLELIRNREILRMLAERSSVIIENAQKLGAEVSRAASLFEKARTAFDGGDYDRGTELTSKALEIVEAARSERAAALVSAVEQMIANARGMGADTSKSEGILSAVREALARGQFERGILLLGQAREEAEIARRVREGVLRAEAEAKARRTREAIKEAMDATDEAVELGMDPGKAEQLLQRAISAADAGEHERAMQLLRQLEAEVREEKEKLPARIEEGFRAALKSLEQPTLTPEESDKTRRALQAAIHFFEKSGELRRLAEAYERLGYLEERLGKLPYSKMLYQKAVNTYFRIGELDQIVTLLVERMKRIEAVSDKRVPEYTIEELFLIYRDGRLIHHNTRRLRPEVDNQLLGGMLVAIQNFIGESFRLRDAEVLNELRYGKTRILLESGKYVYVALVVTGREPEEKRREMRRVIQELEERYGSMLEKWDGDTSKLWGAKKLVDTLITGI
ncbi:MAG: PQQ-binding-like beta-propeller repeat protein [Thermoplasmata archaeon]